MGALAGLVAGIFFRSRRGQQMGEDLNRKAADFQKKILSEFASLREMSRERYEVLVEQAVDAYVKAKEIAQTEAPEVRRFLLRRWEHIQKQLKEGEQIEEEEKKPKGKK